MKRIFLGSILCILWGTATFAQEKKVALTPPALYQEIVQMDSLLFNYFNTRQFEQFKRMFAADLEWFQDNDGLVPRKKVFENFKATFKKPWALTRQLVPGTLEVHPIKNYGAIETGTHQFRHTENGQEETGTFRFLMIWRKQPDGWKVSRVVSYGH